MNGELGFTNVVPIGENRHGYFFCAGQLGDQWFGVAIGKIKENESMAFILPGCSEDEIDHLLPEISEVTDVRDLIIKRVCAVAFSPEHGYGGIEDWKIPEAQRGKLEDFYCAECDSVSCTPGYHEVFDGNEF